MEQFDIPVVLFIFKRNKAVEIIKRIGQVKPKKIYIMADQGRNETEKRQAEDCRLAVESAIDWDCEVIKNYAEENRGVYGNIGLGAIWVLRQERWAIFLEDDNLPEESFFPFCKEMLQLYEKNERILWICGTNYLGDYRSKSGDSYVFTSHMLPCGWASWGSKFERYYDGELKRTEDETVMKKVAAAYCNKKVYEQYKASWMAEKRRIDAGQRPISWDYQMDFTIKAHGLLGICPCRNQIKNIGVDEDSIHGGTSFNMVMTKRFCGMDSYPVEFPLQHPVAVEQDPVFEKKIGRIILIPWYLRSRAAISKGIRKMLKIPKGKSVTQFIKEGFR